MFVSSNPRSLGIHKKRQHPSPTEVSPERKEPEAAEQPLHSSDTTTSPANISDLSVINVVIERQPEESNSPQGIQAMSVTLCTTAFYELALNVSEH